MKTIFLGPNGIRAGWRLLLFLVVAIFLAYGFQSLAQFVVRHLGIEIGDGLDPLGIFLGDGLVLLATVLATLLMARIEHRRWSDYYLPARNIFGRRFWAGSAFGFAAVSLLIGLIALAHGYSPGGLNVTGKTLVHYALLWVAANLMIGFTEEIFFRGYAQFTLATGIGFWPAAWLISLLFGAVHFFTKPNERWTDWACTSLLALFVCFTLRRLGDLRFAIGFHAAFDLAAIYIYSGLNGGEFAKGRLLNATFHGPDSITGGPLGPEASLFIFPVIALLFLSFHWIYRRQAVNRPAR